VDSDKLSVLPAKLEPNFPFSLDTDFQVENWDFYTDQRRFEVLIKLHGLFAPHLVISEAQLLDHLAQLSQLGQ